MRTRVPSLSQKRQGVEVQLDGVRFDELDGGQLGAQLVAVEQVHLAGDLEPRPVGVRETPTRTGMTVGGLTRCMAFQMPMQGPGSAGLRASGRRRQGDGRTGTSGLPH